MKSAPDHLPTWKQNELARIVEVILEHSDDVAMVVLFGSYARGDHKQEGDLAPDRKSGHVSDYDILVITGQGETAYDTVLWQDVELECWRLGLSARAKLIAHDIELVNNRLSEGQFFFKDIDRDGCLLYDSDEFTLAKERKLLPSERLRIAQEHFDEWFKSAKEFWIDFTNAFERKSYKKAAFELHQSAEAAYKTILLVLTNYCPHEHYLGVLSTAAKEGGASVKGIFPQETAADQDRFKLFDYAYIGGRYDPKYEISAADLNLLSACVKKLLDVTQQICHRHLDRLTASNSTGDHS